jgi:crotonobetainyl-CoA:carnitine CoA-transferase CaiB-like acyl-CoA transferase
MSGPLTGIRVVELGIVIAGPAAATLLADWGAEVIKLEPLNGDPQRGNTDGAAFEMDNRGKRSICLDLKTPQGRALAHQLIENADVFLTNLRPSALERLGLSYDELAQHNPRLVYADISGYGRAARDRPGYDVGGFWSRAGIALALTPRGSDPPVPRGGMGDHVTGLATAAGVSAALLARERTGMGQRVSTSLLRSGTYVLGTDLAHAARGGKPHSGLRRMMYNPMLAVYRAGDDRWFWLLGVQATRHWPNVARAVGRPELLDDPRFADMEQLLSHRLELMALLDEAFATRPLEEWAAVFAEHDVWWDPLLSIEEVLEDPLVVQSGAFRDSAEAPHRAIATPVDFSTLPEAPAPRAPETGEHTEQVLLELGWDWDGIARLKDDRVIP